MVQIIEVPGMGEVEFPDDMSDADISAAISQSMGLGEVAPAPVQEAAAEPTASSPQYDMGALGASSLAGGDVLSFGFGDELGAALGVPIEAAIGAYNGTDDGKSLMERIYDGYDRGLRSRRDLMDYAQKQHPVASTVGSVAGAVALPNAVARTTLGAIGQGAAAGAAYGFGSGEDGLENRLANAGVGAGFGVAGAAAGRAIGGVASRRAARETLPTRDQLRNLADQSFQAADDAGVIVAPHGIQRLAGDITNELAEFGYDPALQPRIGVVLNRLGTLSEQNVTLRGMDVLRRVARGAAMSADPSERELGRRVIGHIDDYLDDIPADDLVAGNAEQGSAAIRQARNYWGRMRRLETVEDATTRAERRAASTGSGGNVDNATRQNIRGILDNPRRIRGFTPGERAAMEQVVRGTPTQNAARLLGKLSPQGNGLMMALGAGAGVSNPVVAVPTMAAATVAKRFADGGTGRNVAALTDIIRGGGQTLPEIVQLGRQGLGPAAVGVQRAMQLEDQARVPLSVLLGLPVTQN